MTCFLISLFLNAITSAACCLFVFLGNHKSKINRSFCYFTLNLTIWAGFYFLWGVAENKKDALLFTRCLNNTALFIPVTFFHFCTYLIKDQQRYKKFIKIFYLINLAFLGIGFGPLFIYDVGKIYIFQFWPIAGKLFFYTLVEYLVLTGFSIFLLYQRINAVQRPEQQRLKFVFYGILIAYLGGATNYPLFYKIPFPPFGNSLVILYALSITYAIFKYQLMDIKIVIKKSLVYTTLITFITIFYLLFIYFTEHVVKEMFGYQSLFFSMVAATIIALAFIPLRNFIQNFIEKTLFKGSYMQIAEENQLLRQEIIQSERLKSIAILASGMAHEIKNPLTPIKTFSEQLPSRLDDKEFLLKFSRIINKEVDRIDGLVQELLNFSKPSPPQLKQINIYQLIKQTLDLLNNEIIRHKINLNTLFENKNILINIDPKQIKQALLNVFLNAIEAMPNSGTLTIDSRFRGNDKFIITISDTGCGIEPKDLPHIFDPFFSKKDHGTGLGLSITHEIIKNHNGRILTESELGKGTAFRIELPL